MESSVELGGERRQNRMVADRHTGLTVTEAFAIQEYTESANAYFKGVEIGYTVLKYYITVNAVFFTLMSASASNSTALAGFSGLVIWMPIVPVLLALLLFSSLRHYFDHLENCRSRCQEIKKKFGGLLFTKLGAITHSKDKTGFTAGRGLQRVVCLIVILWFMIWWGYLVHENVIPGDLLQRSWDSVKTFFS